MKSTFATTLVLGLTAAFLQAQTVPGLISYQGRIVTNSSGDGLGGSGAVNRKIIFRLFATATGGTTPLWSEEQTVTISKGDFSVILGQGVPATYNGTPEAPTHSTLLAALGGTDRYLEIVVDNGDGNLVTADTPITPRQRLVSTAFAIRAASADSVTSGTDLNLRDSNHGLGWYGTGRLFNGVNIDGPVLYGAGGGGLGSVNGGTRNLALTWNNSGNVGIGTATPTEKLDIVGNGKFSGNLSVTGAITSGNTVKANGGNGFTFANTGDTDGGLFSPSDGTVTLRTDGNERVRVDSNGNVGIANTSPSEKLDVTGNAKVSGIVTANGGLSFGENTFGANPTEGGTSGNFIAFGTPGFSEDFIGYSSNNFYFKDSPAGGDSTQPSVIVGGGITTGADIVAGNYDASGDRFLHLRTDGDNQFRSGINFHHHNGDYGFSAFSDERTTDGYGFHIDSIFNGTVNSRLFIHATSGDVGIGTMTPTAKLEVAGNIKANGKSVAVGEESLRIIRGTINNDGTTAAGSGFTVDNNNIIGDTVGNPNGQYYIRFNTAFSGTPTITASAYESGNSDIVTVRSATTTGVLVESRYLGGFTDHPITFIAVGPR